jgi:hypothetical protein
LRHHQVHEDYIRQKLAGLLHRLQAIGGLAHHLDFFLQAKESPQPLPYGGIVISN